ncbi:MAG: glycosyltransferase family 4 protein [Desulfobacterales bacterium]|nr:glycosyltransferase family 4 protein [Desulfobacterales bacterium]
MLGGEGLRVAMLSTFFPPWRGGVEVYTRELAERLVERGHQVTVLCARSPILDGAGREEQRPSFTEQLAVRRLRTYLRVYGVPVTPALPLDLMRLKVDVLHASFPNPYNAYVGAHISRLRNIPSILTWHNDLPQMSGRMKVLASLHDLFLTPAYLGCYHRIIATSKVYLESSQLLQQYRRRVVVVPNGVDCGRFHPQVEGQQIRVKYGLQGCGVVLFVGALTRWHGYKGLDVLIRAHQRVVEDREAFLLVVGEGSLKEEYQLLCQELELDDRVIFAGDISDQELPQYYAASDMLVLPSKDKSEGFGLTLLEAGASGKPVVGSNVGGIPSTVSHGLNGLLVPPCDTEALAQAICCLLDDERLRLQMGREARRRAEEQDWNRVAETVERLYLQALGVA